MEQATLGREERLRSKKKIDELFAAGTSFVCYPYRVVYCQTELPGNSPLEILVSIPKKRFKRAVKRNLLRRRTKEAYRLNKSLLLPALREADMHISLSLIYLDKTELTYAQLEKKMKELLKKLHQQLLPVETETESTIPTTESLL